MGSALMPRVPCHVVQIPVNAKNGRSRRAPAGFFVMAWLDGAPVGCGALKVGDGDPAR